MILSGRCLELLLTKSMLRGRDSHLKHLLERGPSSLQQESLWVVAAAEGKLPPGEEEGAVCLEEEDLALLHM
jgi:hypothetical protein